MTDKEKIAQLKDLAEDRKPMIDKDDPDCPFRRDIEALEWAVRELENRGRVDGMAGITQKKLEEIDKTYLEKCQEVNQLREELERQINHNGEAAEMVSNADLIRNMSDEELAVTIMCPNEMGLADIMCNKNENCNCVKCCFDWLRLEDKR